jgi:hypothetical protein
MPDNGAYRHLIRRIRRCVRLHRRYARDGWLECWRASA